MTKYIETPRLLTTLGPQPLWMHYQCIPVWDEPEMLYIVGWQQLSKQQLDDLALIFGKSIHQNSIDDRDALVSLIKAHAVDQPISELL